MLSVSNYSQCCQFIRNKKLDAESGIGITARTGELFIAMLIHEPACNPVIVEFRDRRLDFSFCLQQGNVNRLPPHTYGHRLAARRGTRI